jgi:hypothetical protein
MAFRSGPTPTNVRQRSLRRSEDYEASFAQVAATRETFRFNV